MAAMVGTRIVVVIWVVSRVMGCGAGDNRIDPGDLELRDLLGVSPEAASAWDAPQRAAARRVLAASLHDEAAPPATIELQPGANPDDRIVGALAALDARRFAAGDAALGVVRVELGTLVLVATARSAPGAADALDRPSAAKLELQLSDRWDAWPVLPGRGLGLLAAVAADAGHATGPVVVVPASRLPVIAAYGDGRLVVNPVVLAALEPEPGEVAVTTERIATPTQHVEPTATASDGIGNPYSFYGSVAECAAAQRSRCEGCLPSSTCKPITTASDGNAECTMLAAADGRGYYLECINLALAISSIDECTAKQATGCPQNQHAADSLTDLESNVMFLENATCAMGLDTCLAQLYGTPSQTYPPLVDGGTGMAPPPPRSTAVSCGDSCSNNNENCTASPSCDCSGPSCNNSLSCDSGCSSSNHQGGCDSCSSGSSSSSSGCSSCNDSSSSSSSGCSSCSNSSSSSSSNCGSCSGSGCSGGGCGNSNNSCGSSGKCSVTDDSPSFALAASVMWAFMPVPLAAVMRRRSRRRKKPSAEPEVAP